MNLTEAPPTTGKIDLWTCIVTAELRTSSSDPVGCCGAFLIPVLNTLSSHVSIDYRVDICLCTIMPLLPPAYRERGGWIRRYS